MTARVVSIARGEAGGALARELGLDRLVAYTGVDPSDGRHYYVAAPRGSVPVPRACAQALADALNNSPIARVGTDGGSDADSD